MPRAVDACIRENETRLLEELKEFIRIAGISTLSEHEGDVRQDAQFVVGSLQEAGLGNAASSAAAKHPPVYAGWLHAPGQRAVVCHGHYDGLHSFNEKFRIENYYLGILTVTHFLGKYGAA